ncbi:MAG: RNA polymerase sigma factor [Thermocrispum sp.]
MTSPNPSDQELWSRAVGGDRHAFAELFDRHGRAVYHHCFRLTASAATAEDLLQNTFLLAWRKRERVRLRNDSALPWLLAVATNAVRSERRSVARRVRMLQRTQPEPPTADHADAVADRVDSERRMAELLAAVQELPRAQREAFTLCVWGDQSYPDAAAALGVAESTVRVRVSRARARLSQSSSSNPMTALVPLEDR